MDERVETVVSFIRTHYRQRLSLADMGQMVSLSQWRLCHLFKLALGTSPKEFLTQVRLEKAKGLLETEFLTVKEVINEVGICDASYFTRSFKATYGMTPAECRRGRKKR
jgi:two-component system response regulator YesN